MLGEEGRQADPEWVTSTRPLAAAASVADRPAQPRGIGLAIEQPGLPLGPELALSSTRKRPARRRPPRHRGGVVAGTTSRRRRTRHRHDLPPGPKETPVTTTRAATATRASSGPCRACPGRRRVVGRAAARAASGRARYRSRQRLPQLGSGRGPGRRRPPAARGARPGCRGAQRATAGRSGGRPGGGARRVRFGRARRCGVVHRRPGRGGGRPSVDVAGDPRSIMPTRSASVSGGARQEGGHGVDEGAGRSRMDRDLGRQLGTFHEADEDPLREPEPGRQGGHAGDDVGRREVAEGRSLRGGHEAMIAPRRKPLPRRGTL